jgi:CheY-like chemotaxis protein/signal transduction histidine kinase
MNSMSSIYSVSILMQEPFLVLGALAWTFICLALIVLIILLIFCVRRIQRLKNQSAELHVQVIEKSELLTYATEREQKVLNQVASANQSKKTLLSRVNHEIRTPMNGVIGMAQLLGETSLTPEQREYNETIRSCSEELMMVINDILHGDLLAEAKLETSKVELQYKEFDLRSCIEEVLEVFSNQSDVDLLYRLDPAIPSTVIGDIQRIRQVLINLVENAVKFTHEGETIIKVSLVNGSDNIRPGENTALIYFEVRDCGAGITAERLHQLNHDLRHGTKTSQPQYTGVGLFVCHKLVGLMGGDLQVSSTPLKGTSVSFTIPLQVVKSSHSGTAIGDFSSLVGKKILIVDDNVHSGDVIFELLTQWGLEASTADSASKAIEILGQQGTPDLVLIDHKMPGTNGVQLAERIAAEHPGTPMLLLSHEGMQIPDSQAGIFDAILFKPIKQHLLKQHIISSLRKHVGNMLTEERNTGHKLSIHFAEQYPLRILIAEDNLVNQKLALKILGKLGYKADVANDGKIVLEIVGNTKYDLILMDVQMPEMDGLEATRMIRLCLETQPVIIAMTANSMQGDREECLRAGMDDYISKPVHIEELVVLLEKWATVVKEKR